MFTDLATYISETQDYLWKPNDAALETALPKIIRQAEARIRTDLKIQAEEVTLYVDITENPYQLPTDCATLRTLVWDQYGPSTYTTPRDFSRATSAPLLPGGISQNSANLLEHTIEGQRLRHRMNVSPTAPMSARPPVSASTTGSRCAKRCATSSSTAWSAALGRIRSARHGCARPLPGAPAQHRQRGVRRQRLEAARRLTGEVDQKPPVQNVEGEGHLAGHRRAPSRSGEVPSARALSVSAPTESQPQ